MNGLDLFRLGRRLMKLGVGAIPPSSFRDLPTSVRMVLVDVIEHPGSTIGQIVERTGFPQSHVSAAVARLREAGMLDTDTDPLDRRRTLVTPSADHLAHLARVHREIPPIDDALVASLMDVGDAHAAARAAEIHALLERLAVLLTPPPRGDRPC